MEPIQNAGIVVILFLQSLGDWLTAPMALLSEMGHASFFLLLMAALYWCVDAGLGLRVATPLLFSVWLNDTLKLALHNPRPFWISQQIRALGSEFTFGLPSGHAQHAVVLWGLLAASAGRPWAWAVALALMLLIGLSRIYLGLHFPSDVAAGWAIGALLLFAFLRWQGAAASWLRSRPFVQQVLMALAVSLALLALSCLSLASLADWQMPEIWVQNVLANTGTVLHPLTLGNILLSAGALCGLWIGAAWLQRQGGFSAEGPVVKRLARYILGLAGVVVLWLGLEILFPQQENMWGYGLSYLRAALLGCWVAGGAPAVFIRLKLADERR